MEIKFGLISADSHVVFDRDAMTSRMSATKWGDRIPQVVEREVDGELVESGLSTARPPGTTSPTVPP